jgi:hypothetical protein
MRLIQLVNFRKENGKVTDIGASNKFTCQFSRAVTIKPHSKVCLIHAEINNTLSVPEGTGITLNGTGTNVGGAYTESEYKSQDLVYINIPSLPINTVVGHANGGKGQTNHIVGIARTNNTDMPFNTGISVDLGNTHDLVLTELQVELLDTDYDLKVFGVGPFRQSITLGIEENKLYGARGY